MVRELIKDLENMKGDLLMDYKTIPVVYGEQASKVMLTLLIMLTSIPVYLLLTQFHVGHMSLFSYLSVILLLLFLLLLWKSSPKTHYLILHNILKFIIVAGVFSIVLINISIVLNRF